MDFSAPEDHRVKLKESEKKDMYQDLAWELKKTVEHESDGDTKDNWCPCYSHQKIDKRTRGLGNNRTSRDHPNYSIIKICQNTEKSPGDLRIISVTQTSLRNHRRTQEWKTLKRVIIILNNNNKFLGIFLITKTSTNKVQCFEINRMPFIQNLRSPKLFSGWTQKWQVMGWS